MSDEKEFTASQLQWAVWVGRNTRHDEEYVVRLARGGLGMTWAGDVEEEDEDDHADG